jgi:hypothetical protein
MIRELQFPVFKLLMPLWQRNAVVHAVLKLENGEEFSLSGFPRCLSSTVTHSKIAPLLFVLLADEGVPGSIPKNEEDVIGQGKVPTWSAPDLSGAGLSGTWDKALPLRSVLPGQDESDISDEPGPAEHVPAYGKVEDDATALPKYSR